MNDLVQAMNRLCPDGVKFEPIGSVVQRGTNIRWAEATAGQDFQYIDLTSVDRVTHAITETQTITSENAPSRARQVVRVGDVIFGTTRPMLKRYAAIPADYDGQIASTGYCVLRPSQGRILTSFLFYLLGTPEFYGYVEANERGASYPAITDSAIKAFRIPVPPIEVQHEIVHVLDSFRTLKAELVAAIERELDARLVQYSSCRKALLSFDEVNVKWSSLGDIASVHTGQAPHPGVLADDGHFPFVNAGTTASGLAAESNTPGDTVTIPSRGQGGVGIAGYQSSDFWCGPLCYRIRSTDEHLLNRYLFHYLKSVQSEIRGLQQVGGTPALNRKELVLVKVPVPLPAEQERIAGIIDRLDTSVTELRVALSAEIDARRTQYEYYRDRLLTFEERAV